MSKELSKIDKLASLDELHFLLMEALHDSHPMQKEDLALLCRHRSINFMLSFENTLLFLSTLAIIDVQPEGTVTKSKTITWPHIQSHQELSALILVKLLEYLSIKKLLPLAFGEKVMISKQPGNLIVLHSSQMSLSVSYIKIFLLHAGIVIIDRNLPNRLIVDKKYEEYFRPLFESNIPPPETPIKIIPPKVSEVSQARGFNFFISYSFKDEAYKIALKSHFMGLISNGSIKAWDGRAILPGEDWDQEIKKKLEEATVILFLVSSDFMDSDYIKDVEIKHALERYERKEVKIIPIIVRPCDFDNHPLNKLMAVPTGRKPISTWKNADEAYLDVVINIRRILKLT